MNLVRRTWLYFGMCTTMLVLLAGVFLVVRSYLVSILLEESMNGFPNRQHTEVYKASGNWGCRELLIKRLFEETGSESNKTRFKALSALCKFGLVEDYSAYRSIVLSLLKDVDPQVRLYAYYLLDNDTDPQAASETTRTRVAQVVVYEFLAQPAENYPWLVRGKHWLKRENVTEITDDLTTRLSGEDSAVRSIAAEKLTHVYYVYHHWFNDVHAADQILHQLEQSGEPYPSDWIDSARQGN